MSENESRLDWDGIFTFLLTLAVCILSLGSSYLIAIYQVVRTAATRRPAATPSTLILVPGKRLVDNRPDPDFRCRLEQAAKLALGPLPRQILILGGTTQDADISEAEAGARHLRSLERGDGLDIQLESRSQNTLTNLRNVREMLREGSRGPKVTLISNRYHLARIGLIASSLGMPHLLWPAEDEFQPDRILFLVLLREALFYLWFVVGKGWSVITHNRRMLDRVT